MSQAWTARYTPDIGPYVREMLLCARTLAACVRERLLCRLHWRFFVDDKSSCMRDLAACLTGDPYRTLDDPPRAEY